MLPGNCFDELHNLCGSCAARESKRGKLSTHWARGEGKVQTHHRRHRCHHRHHPGEKFQFRWKQWFHFWLETEALPPCLLFSTRHRLFFILGQDFGCIWSPNPSLIVIVISIVIFNPIQVIISKYWQTSDPRWKTSLGASNWQSPDLDFVKRKRF